MSQANKHLYNLNELTDYKISDGYPDVRGWVVKDDSNQVIGKVDNLLVNKDALRVVYLDVEVDKSIIDANHDPYGRPDHIEVREFVNNDGDNHVIIPIGLVDINDDAKYVYTNTISHQTFSETKRYRKGDTLNRAYENQVLDSYVRRTPTRDVHDRTIDAARPQYNQMDNDDRIRAIVREEIKRYHSNTDTYWDASTHDDLELNRRRRNDDVNDDDLFYDQREFDDEHFKKRTPGL